MIGRAYWSCGIKVFECTEAWIVSLQFYDDGFCKDASTEGTLRVRYVVKDLPLAIDTLKADAERMGILWSGAVGGPTVYCEQDGEFETGDRPDLRRIANEQAARIGWRQIYHREIITPEGGAE